MTIMKEATDLAAVINVNRTEAEFLIRRAMTYHRIQERRCSEEMSDAATAAMEKREAGIEKAILATVAGNPTVKRVEFEGDPRGYCVKLHLISGEERGIG